MEVFFAGYLFEDLAFISEALTGKTFVEVSIDIVKPLPKIEKLTF